MLQNIFSLLIPTTEDKAAKQINKARKALANQPPDSHSMSRTRLHAFQFPAMAVC